MEDIIAEINGRLLSLEGRVADLERPTPIRTSTSGMSSRGDRSFERPSNEFPPFRPLQILMSVLGVSP